MEIRIQFILLIIFVLTGLALYFSSVLLLYFNILLSLLLFFTYKYKTHLIDKLLSYWMILGNALGKIINPIILSFIYILVVMPIGLASRIFTKNIISPPPGKESYWIKVDKKSYKKYFDEQF